MAIQKKSLIGNLSSRKASPEAGSVTANIQMTKGAANVALSKTIASKATPLSKRIGLSKATPLSKKIGLSKATPLSKKFASRVALSKATIASKTIASKKIF
jgi:hypothetical protein